MLPLVPSRFATGALLTVLLAVVAAPATARAPTANPTPNQIASALRKAERSKQLWATVNICDTHRHPDTIGVRSQVPALGFPTSISISLGVQFWSAADKRFESVPGVRKVIRLAPLSRGIHQRGVTFRFGPHAGRLRGTARFAWSRRGRVLGRTEQHTTRGHRDADFGDPPKFSAATCTIR
jgi:hypothetical protein